MARCEWCGKAYAAKDSSAAHRDKYCSKQCENEDGASGSSCSGGGGFGTAILKLVGIVVVLWIGWAMIKGLWNLIFG